MSITAPASEVRKAFGAFHDRALSEPVRVTKYGRETVYIVSAETHHALKQGLRDAIAAADLADEEAAPRSLLTTRASRFRKVQWPA